MSWQHCCSVRPTSVSRQHSMAGSGSHAEARLATLVVLVLAAPRVGGVGLATDQHGCRRLCESVQGQSDAETSDKVSACEEGCLTVSNCHHHHGSFEEKGDSMASDMSESCLTMCENSCSKLYGAKTYLGSACIDGCGAQHQEMEDLETIADEQYSSQREEILEDAGSGIGIKENKTHNVSLNLAGNILTNVSSNSFLGPVLEKDGISTRGRKNVEDRTVKFDLQSDMDNDTVAERTLSKYGKTGDISFGKKGKEYSENTAINIQGIISRNGSYVDVSSKYKPLIKRIFKSTPRRRRKKGRKTRSKKGFGRRPRYRKVKNRKGKKPKPKELGNVIPQEEDKAVKTPVANE